MKDKKPAYTVGKGIESWNEGNILDLTFIVTEDCNLRCKYCYITHKASNKRMNFKVAEKFIDYLFASGICNSQPAIVLDFIGGEPLLEVDLIDDIVSYFIQKAYESGSSWFWNYRINICTNGVNYTDQKVQNFLDKYKSKLSISITIDGIKDKHDLQRVFPNGEGSYDVVEKSVQLWIKQYGVGTKVTFASQDLQYLKDSIISLYEKEIKEIAANVVFEDVWSEGDDILFENQLRELADYILDNGLYNKFICTLFDEQIGGYYNDEELFNTFCGAGKMIAVGPDGKIYPCLRYKDYSLNNQEERSIGNIVKGIDFEKVRPFMLASIKYQSDNECQNCEVANGCAFCQGFNYDESPTGTNFFRAKYICKMHKARVRANDYYFSKLYNMYGIERENEFTHKRKNIVILESNKIHSICPVSFESKPKKEKIINSQIIDHLNYVRKENAIPIILHSDDEFDYVPKEEYKEYRIYHIFPLKHYSRVKEINLKDCTYYVDCREIDDYCPSEKINGKMILNIRQSELKSLFKSLQNLYLYVDSIDVNIMDMNADFDFKLYKNQLKQLKEYLMKNRNKRNNLLSSHFDKQSENKFIDCENLIVISPEEKLYPCILSYIEEKESIGNLSDGVINKEIQRQFASATKPLCNHCEHKICHKCSHYNLVQTKEYNVAPSYWCKKTYIENKVDNFETIDCIPDPLEKYLKDHMQENLGYYHGNTHNLEER